MLSFSAFIAVAMSSVVLFWYKYNQNKEQAIEMLFDIVSIMGENLVASIEFDDAESAKSILLALKANSTIDGAYIFKEDKILFSSYVRDGVKETTIQKKIAAVYGANEIKNEVKQIDIDNIIINKPIYKNGKYLASFLIVSNTDNIKKLLITQFYIQVGSLIFVIFIVTLLAFRLQKIFTLPIFSLKNAMDAVREKNNYESTITEKSNDEFQSLFDGFHKMLETIKEQKIKLENHTKTLNETIEEKTKDINKKNRELEISLKRMDQNVILSETDLHGIITHVSEAFCAISGYSHEELIGQSHNIVRHPDMDKDTFKEMWGALKSQACWFGEVKNLRKDGTYYWVFTKVEPSIDSDGRHVGYYAIRQDITAKKAVEELSAQQAIQMREIERSNRLLSGRENRMVELKEQINKYKIKLGEEAEYTAIEVEDLSFEEKSDLFVEEGFDLQTLLDVEQLQKMMESFYKMMHIPLAIIDLSGNILVQSKWQRACTDFHRANSESCKRCIESDTDMANKLEIGENFISYKCSNGLIDCASPIIVGGKHVANFFIGQFLIHEPDMEFFTNQAKFFGYDVEDYRASILDIPVIKEDMLPYILGFLTEITAVVTSYSIEKLKSQHNENINKMRAIELQKGQTAAMNLAEDAEKARVEIQNYKEHLEVLVDERTQELHEQKEFIQTVLDSQEQIIITTNGITILSANEEFFDFYSVDSIEKFKEEYNTNCICETFNKNAPEGYLQISMDDEKWIDYVIARSHSNITHKVMITKEDINYIFSVTAAILPGNKGLKSAVFTDITAIEEAKQEAERIHKHTKESIEYASLIQHALIPANDLFQKFFSESLTLWHPKDIVGGDIYLFEELRNEEECILFVVDCTGHGVPGAFVTMLVKAIERQIVSNIIYSDESVSPAKILSVFNRSMKHLLKQESEDSISNAGFDGAIIYYNKKEQIVKYAGANTALFYTQEKELITIKGDRHSIGYKKSDNNFVFTDHTIEALSGMQFFITTDGYLDQNGGEKGFPFGVKRFKEILTENMDESMADKQEILLYEMQKYQKDEERNDDVTVIGFKI
jgi:PAS domain S-box-containing protein